MRRFLKHGVPALIALSTILWAAENLYFMKHASAHATKACIDKESKFAAIFDGPNSYYWCQLQRLREVIRIFERP